MWSRLSRKNGPFRGRQCATQPVTMVVTIIYVLFLRYLIQKTCSRVDKDTILTEKKVGKPYHLQVGYQRRDQFGGGLIYVLQARAQCLYLSIVGVEDCDKRAQK